jgi:hypothetical protein
MSAPAPVAFHRWPLEATKPPRETRHLSVAAEP